MPIYRYECLDCSEEFEVIASLAETYSADYSAICPICECEENKRLISRTSFSLKGDRWYKDGYSNKQNDEGDT